MPYLYTESGNPRSHYWGNGKWHPAACDYLMPPGPPSYYSHPGQRFGNREQPGLNIADEIVFDCLQQIRSSVFTLTCEVNKIRESVEAAMQPVHGGMESSSSYSSTSHTSPAPRDAYEEKRFRTGRTHHLWEDFDANHEATQVDFESLPDDLDAVTRPSVPYPTDTESPEHHGHPDYRLLSKEPAEALGSRFHDLEADLELARPKLQNLRVAAESTQEEKVQNHVRQLVDSLEETINQVMTDIRAIHEAQEDAGLASPKVHRATRVTSKPVNAMHLPEFHRSNSKKLAVDCSCNSPECKAGDSGVSAKADASITTEDAERTEESSMYR
ncbi:hypothetical protein BJ170DRAFT_369877 [Xylariales sp. AK1849]|nr:hypothetical protein BJ170DRAFT_369877 [Xylariales sp. AK1849]